MSDHEENEKPEGAPQASHGGPTGHTPVESKPSLGRLALAILVLGVVIAALVIGRRVTHAATDAPPADASRPARVLVAHARLAAADVPLRLPGSVEAVYDSVVHARATGYVARLLVDLGDSVHEGQLLAEIRAPETMDELHAAEARTQQAAEQSSWARESAERTRALSERGIATTQELDDARLALVTAEQAQRAAEADTQRLRSVRRYQAVLAPFDGVVVERLVNLGQLVTEGTSDVGLFRVARVGQLKVTIDVPQIYAALVTVGQSVEVERPDQPGTSVTGTVWHIAGELTSTTRTMRIEALLPDQQGILGGMFVNVRLTVHRDQPPVIIPWRALTVTPTGPVVWTVDGNVVHPHAVTIGRDLGRELELATGLSGNEMIVLSPPDGIADGNTVEVVDRTAPTP